MKKILGLITLFLCVTLFIWANFIATSENTMIVENITADDGPMIIESADTDAHELIDDNKDIIEQEIK